MSVKKTISLMNRLNEANVINLKASLGDALTAVDKTGFLDEDGYIICYKYFAMHVRDFSREKEIEVAAKALTVATQALTDVAKGLTANVNQKSVGT